MMAKGDKNDKEPSSQPESSKSESSSENTLFESLDHSSLQKSINLGVKNVQQILQCIQGGSAEVKDAILNECDIIYECKVCRTLFRSLANFLAHKRFYCKEHCCESMVLFPSNFPEREDNVVVVQPQSPEAAENEDNEMVDQVAGQPQSPEPTSSNEDITEISKQVAVVRLKSPQCPVRDVTQMLTCQNSSQSEESISVKNTNIEKSFYESCIDYLQHKKSANKETIVHLEKINGNKNAVFQKIKTNDDDTEDIICLTTKKEPDDKDITVVMPEKPNTSEEPVEKNSETLTRAKKLSARIDCDVKKLSCLKCNTQYTSIKTLYFHMISIHAQKRLYYPCPFCKQSFVQMWGVTRHLTAVHNKSKEQVNKLRSVIKKRAFLKNVETGNKVEKQSDKENSKSKEKLVLPPIPPGVSHLKVSPKTYNKFLNISRNFQFHQCSKCHRLFGRKSSQVSHEKFCIMNTLKPDLPVLNLTTSLPQQVHVPSSPSKMIKTELNVISRPKRIAEKRMHKDFVNSQTLKFRKTDTEPVSKSTKKQTSSNIAKKVQAIINADKLLCLKCKRKFSTFSNLRRHAAIHVGWTRFKCKYCAYQAYNRSDCRSHIQRVHSLSPTTNIDKLILNLPSGSASVKKDVASGSLKIVGNSASKVFSENTKPKVKSETKKDSKKESPGQRSRSSSAESRKQCSTPLIPPPPVSPQQSTSSSATVISVKKANSPTSPTSKSSGPDIIVLSRPSPTRSPRKTETKSGSIDSLTTLVTRSGAYPKANLLPLKLPSPESSNQQTKLDVKKPNIVLKKPNILLKKPDIVVKIPDRTYSKKDRQSVEWIKKPVSDSYVVQKQSHPLIIGLVRATSIDSTHGTRQRTHNLNGKNTE